MKTKPTEPLSFRRRPIPGASSYHWVEVILFDPSSRNAWSQAANRQLEWLLTEGWQATDRALVLRASGPVFCSGGQLSDYAKASTRAEGDKVNAEIRATLKRLRRLAGPTVATVQGDAFGGGVELLSCFDHVIVSPFSVLHFWQRKIGLSYGWGGGRRIAARCGLAPARALLQSARSLTANQALELGLVDRVIAASTQELEAQRYISKWLRTNPQSGSRIKRWSPKQESAVFADLWWAEEHRAALKERAP